MQKPLTFLAPFVVAASLALPAVAQDDTAENTDAQTDVTAETVVATVNGTDITIGSMIIARATLHRVIAAKAVYSVVTAKRVDVIIRARARDQIRAVGALLRGDLRVCHLGLCHVLHVVVGIVVIAAAINQSRKPQKCERW